MAKSKGLTTSFKGAVEEILRARDEARSKLRLFSKDARRKYGERGIGSVLDTPVRAVMTEDVRVCLPHDRLDQAAKVMWDADCGVVPIVDSQGSVVGVVTDRDICMASYTRGSALSSVAVQDTMSRHASTCRASDTIERALELMGERQIRRLVVVNSEGRLAGIVSIGDIARKIASNGSARARAALTEALTAISTPRAASFSVAAQ